jgi:radial spoke head protein 1
LNGDQYEGDYRHQQRCGFGSYVFQNGARYIGEWVAGQKQGQGKFHYPDGSSYDGEWRKDRKHGFGVYTYPNGDTYEGTWYRNLKHGVGTYRFGEEKLALKSVWHYGISKGAVEVKHAAFYYHGAWAQHKLCGDGVFVFDAKYMASGFWYTPPPLPGRAPEEEEGGEEEGSLTSKQETAPPAVWKVRTITKYECNKLPPEPTPLPFIDSDNKDLCPAISGSEEDNEEYVEDISQPTGLEENEETGPEDEIGEEEQSDL